MVAHCFQRFCFSGFVQWIKQKFLCFTNPKEVTQHISFQFIQFTYTFVFRNDISRSRLGFIIILLDLYIKTPFSCTLFLSLGRWPREPSTPGVGGGGQGLNQCRGLSNLFQPGRAKIKCFSCQGQGQIWGSPHRAWSGRNVAGAKQGQHNFYQER